MIHLFISLFFLVIMPTILSITEVISPSVYFMILAGIGIVFGTITILFFWLTDLGLVVAPFMIAPIMRGLFAYAVIGSIALFSHTFFVTKKATKTEQTKVLVKTKTTSENKVKHKHS